MPAAPPRTGKRPPMPRGDSNGWTTVRARSPAARARSPEASRRRTGGRQPSPAGDGRRPGARRRASSEDRPRRVGGDRGSSPHAARRQWDGERRERRHEGRRASPHAAERRHEGRRASPHAADRRAPPPASHGDRRAPPVAAADGSDSESEELYAPARPRPVEPLPPLPPEEEDDDDAVGWPPSKPAWQERRGRSPPVPAAGGRGRSRSPSQSRAKALYEDQGEDVVLPFEAPREGGRFAFTGAGADAAPRQPPRCETGTDPRTPATRILQSATPPVAPTRPDVMPRDPALTPPAAVAAAPLRGRSPQRSIGVGMTPPARPVEPLVSVVRQQSSPVRSAAVAEAEAAVQPQRGRSRSPTSRQWSGLSKEEAQRLAAVASKKATAPPSPPSEDPAPEAGAWTAAPKVSGSFDRSAWGSGVGGAAAAGPEQPAQVAWQQQGNYVAYAAASQVPPCVSPALASAGRGFKPADGAAAQLRGGKGAGRDGWGAGQGPESRVAGAAWHAGRAEWDQSKTVAQQKPAHAPQLPHAPAAGPTQREKQPPVQQQVFNGAWYPFGPGMQGYTQQGVFQPALYSPSYSYGYGAASAEAQPAAAQYGAGYAGYIRTAAEQRVGQWTAAQQVQKPAQAGYALPTLHAGGTPMRQGVIAAGGHGIGAAAIAKPAPKRGYQTPTPPQADTTRFDPAMAQYMQPGAPRRVADVITVRNSGEG
eukprot:TRINITY_DN4132_c1_g1_i1.p1 TRINITY_DN4132_c1_g1~~TRINITY_DN4132_c1_g1_i1.p1  ORF type:complete len:721 (+),score=199.86 TRINITY_DN4132_c1_g1_i1:47-2164(+)